jgi:hypothetical protein
MRIKLSRQEWETMGIGMGWLKKAEGMGIEAVAEGLKFVPTKKKAVVYRPWNGGVGEMPPLTYKVMGESGRTDTSVGGELETTRAHSAGDVMVCGPEGEKYTMPMKKFKKNYEGEVGGEVTVEQTPRMVAQYSGTEQISFTASWGEAMVLKPGDYLVKEGEGQYYRIEKGIFEKTYNPISSLTKEAKKGGCWKGYKQVGMKRKGNRMVPNCVPK